MCKAIKASGNTAGKAWSLCVTIHLPGRCTSGTEFIKQSQSTGFHTSTCQRPSLDGPQTIVSALQSNETSWSEGWTRSELRPSKQHARHFAPTHAPEERCFLLCLKPIGDLWRYYQSSWLDSSSSQERSCSVETRAIAGMVTNHYAAKSCLLHSSSPYLCAFLYPFPGWSCFH